MLCSLAQAYNVDKCPNIKAKYSTHTYTPKYELLLKDIRLNVTSMLEIGIGNVGLMSGIIDNYSPGCSLRMWRDYFPNAKIYGCDIVSSVLFQEDRIKTFYVDQSDPKSLKNLVTSISEFPYMDVILDDGSHQKDHQEISFQNLWSFVKPKGGIYIIEDVNVNNIDYLVDLAKRFNFTDCECIYKHYGAWDGDNFVAFRKN